MIQQTLNQACDKIEEINEDGGNAYFKGERGGVKVIEEVIELNPTEVINNDIVKRSSKGL